VNDSKYSEELDIFMMDDKDSLDEQATLPIFPQEKVMNKSLERLSLADGQIPSVQPLSLVL